MSENYERTAAWLKACGKQPCEQNFNVQLGCHIEEVLELFDGLEIGVAESTPIEKRQAMINNIETALAVLGDLADALKNGQCGVRVTNRESFLDALCDAEVTANGVAYLGGFNKPPADEAVLYANELKLVDGKPVLLPNGKIGKPLGWAPPDLSGFV